MDKIIPSILNQYGVNTLDDITGEMIWDIFKKCREKNRSGSMEKNALRNLVYDNPKLAQRIDDDDKINMRFLCQTSIEKYVIDDEYTPLPHRPDVEFDPKTSFKVVWFTRGWDKYDKKMRARDFYTVDYSPLDEEMREIMIRYTVTTNSKPASRGVGEIVPIVAKYLEGRSKNNINSKAFTYSDGSILREMCKKKDDTYSDKKQFYLRDFFKYLETLDGYTVETGFYKALKITSKKSNEPEGIPEEDLKKLEKKMKENASSERGTIMYGVFLLLLTTKLRLSSIISLKEDDIHQGDKKDQYFIDVKTKKSKGKTERMAISKLTYDILIKCREIAKSCEDKYKIRDYKGCIFQWEAKGIVRHLTPQNFEEVLKKCCSESGIPYYNPARLRKVFMTNAYDYGTANNFTDLDRSIMTGHISQDTTIEHYYDQTISRVVEGKYHITVGDPQILKRIDERNQIGIEQLAESKAVSDEYIVSNQSSIVGFCRRDDSCLEGGLPCWCCSSFYTTPYQLPVFEAEMDRLQELRKRAKLDHDILNIETQMSLVGTFIAMLKTKRKEMNI